MIFIFFYDAHFLNILVEGTQSDFSIDSLDIAGFPKKLLYSIKKMYEKLRNKDATKNMTNFVLHTVVICFEKFSEFFTTQLTLDSMSIFRESHFFVGTL